MKLLSLLFILLCFLSSMKAATGQEENATSASPVPFKPKPTRVSFKNVAYGVEGFISSAGNLLIVFAIMTNKALRRKELIIVAGLAMSEFIYGFGYFTGGIRRGWMEVTGYIKHPSTPWHCMWVVHNPFFIAGAPCEAIMLVIASVDRLLAVKAPVWYWKQRNKYAYTCLSLAFGLTAVYLIAGIIGAYFKPVNDVVTLKCQSSMALPDWMGTVKNVLQALGGWGSVLCFVLVVYFYRQQGKTQPNEQLKEEHMKRQRRMTKTIGLCVLVTLFTVCIGRTAKSVMSALRDVVIHRQTYYYMDPLMSVFINFNMMANVFVYSYRQREIRAAIVRILTCGLVKLSVEKPTTKARSTQQQRNFRVAPEKQEGSRQAGLNEVNQEPEQNVA